MNILINSFMLNISLMNSSSNITTFIFCMQKCRFKVVCILPTIFVSFSIYINFPLVWLPYIILIQLKFCQFFHFLVCTSNFFKWLWFYVKNWKSFYTFLLKSTFFLKYSMKILNKIPPINVACIQPRTKYHLSYSYT